MGGGHRLPLVDTAILRHIRCNWLRAAVSMRQDFWW